MDLPDIYYCLAGAALLNVPGILDFGRINFIRNLPPGA